MRIWSNANPSLGPPQEWVRVRGHLQSVFSLNSLLDDLSIGNEKGEVKESKEGTAARTVPR
jgi:hypothetical protein